jgi:hypothetical protein
MILVLPLQAIAGLSSCFPEQGSDQDHQMMMGDHSCCPDNQDTKTADHHCYCQIAVHAMLPMADISDSEFNRKTRYIFADVLHWPSQTYQPEKPPQIS